MMSMTLLHGFQVIQNNYRKLNHLDLDKQTVSEWLPIMDLFTDCRFGNISFCPNMTELPNKRFLVVVVMTTATSQLVEFDDD